MGCEVVIITAPLSTFVFLLKGYADGSLMMFSIGLEMLGHTDRWLKPAAAAAKGNGARCSGGKELVYGRLC